MYEKLKKQSFSEISSIIDDNYSKCLEFSNHRFKSWEHCYEFFKSRYFIGAASDDEAALHLSFYLASWGMYRGSSFLLSYDYKINVEIVKLLKENQNISSNQEIFDLHDKLRRKYIKLTDDKNREELSAILTTKIMLGVYGIVPAYDSFFKNALKVHGFTQKFGVKSLNELDTIKPHFTEYADKIGYPVMKVIDMYFWVIGSWNPLEVNKEVYIALQGSDKVDLPTLNSNIVCGKKLLLPMGLNGESRTEWFNDNGVKASDSFIRNTKNNLFIYYREV